MPSDTSFLKQALAAIQTQDYPTLEKLRDKVNPDGARELVRTWKPSMSWLTKDGYVALLMDQTGEVVRPLMEDALNSPTVESQAYALCSLTGNFGIFDGLLTNGGVDPDKVKAAIVQYRFERRRQSPP